MLAKSLSALAVIAFVAQVSASEPMPYKAQPKLMKMSVRDMFGIQRRSDTYQPSQSQCGDGATCAEACGTGYDTCTSTDSAVHCYNPAAAEICCSDNSGNSCEAGYYCAGDSQGETWCCPNGTDLATCAQQFSVTGALTSETPRATTTSVSSTSSTVVKTTTTSSHSTHNSTKTAVSNNSTTSCTSTISSSATFAVANSTKPAVVSSTTTSAPSTVSSSAANLLGPAGALAMFVASGFAALL